MSRVQRRPLLSLLASTAILVALALPALDLRTGSAGVRTIPDGYASKDGFNALERELGVGTVDRADIVVVGDSNAAPVRDGVEQLRAALASDPAFRSPEVTIGAERGRRGRRGARRRRQPRRARRCRRSSGSAPRSCPAALGGADVETYVTGETAEIVDYRELMARLAADRLPVRARAQLHPADGRVPLARRAGEGDRAQPALGRRRLRADRARLPEGRRQRAARLRAGGRDRGVAAALPLLRSLRALDGLPGVPAQPDPRAVHADRGLERGGRRSACGPPRG